jgi:hypothetical protein
MQQKLKTMKETRTRIDNKLEFTCHSRVNGSGEFDYELVVVIVSFKSEIS